jgi:hypothetical protein
MDASLPPDWRHGNLVAMKPLRPLAASFRAEAKKDHHVILVSVDGLAHYGFDDPKCHMPTIRGQ